MYDWHGWVRRVLKLEAEWNEFYLVNAFVIVLGISCAMVGWRQPAIALVFPAFMLVNGILFHIVPVLVTRIFSPGLFTAVILFVPIGSWAYYGAWRDGVLSIGTAILSGVIGFLLMMFPIVLQKTKRLPFFSQSETVTSRCGATDYDHCGNRLLMTDRLQNLSRLCENSVP